LQVLAAAGRGRKAVKAVKEEARDRSSGPAGIMLLGSGLWKMYVMFIYFHIIWILDICDGMI